MTAGIRLSLATNAIPRTKGQGNRSPCRYAAARSAIASLATSFLASLAVSRQPSRDLYAMFEGWRSRIEAIKAAEITGTFVPSDDIAVIERRRWALAEYERLTKEAVELRARAKRAKQISHKVEINQKIKAITDALAGHKQVMIGGAP